MQKCNQAGLELIANFEGFSSAPYKDSGGLWTQGYGHRLVNGPIPQWLAITKDEAMVWLQQDVEIAEDAIDRLVTWELTPNQFSAMVSFVYNIGQGNFEKSAVLISLNKGDFDDVPTHMLAWNKDHAGNELPGLTRRRNAEIALYETLDDYPDAATGEDSVVST